MSDLLVAFPLSQRQPLRICTDVSRNSSSSLSSNWSIAPAITPNTSNRQCFFHVRCMHDFESSDPVHLPFQKDEVLTIIKQEHSGWWAAMRPQGDCIGWIPSSFVLPLDRGMTVDYPDETPWPYESSDGSSPSAMHDPWVPVSEDYKALSFRLVTPTDHTLHRSFCDDRAQNHNYESSFHLSNDKRCMDIGGNRVPPMQDSPSLHMAQRLPLSPRPLSSGLGVLRITRPAYLSPFDADPCHYGYSCGVDDEIPIPCLATPVNADAIAPELTSNLNATEPLASLKSVTTFDDTYSKDTLSQLLRLPAKVHLGAS